MGVGVREGPGIHSEKLVIVDMKLAGEGEGKCMQGREFQKVEMVRGENSQKTLEYIRGGVRQQQSLPL